MLLKFQKQVKGLLAHQFRGSIVFKISNLVTIESKKLFWTGTLILTASEPLILIFKTVIKYRHKSAGHNPYDIDSWSLLRDIHQLFALTNL